MTFASSIRQMIESVWKQAFRRICGCKKLKQEESEQYSGCIVSSSGCIFSPARKLVYLLQRYTGDQ
jgi:Txe/YoeB family toxin of Txe-Axe toxin-antitoxin module